MIDTKSRSLKRSPFALSFLFLTILAATPASGQIVRGQVVDSVTGSPISTGVVALLDTTGTEVERTMTDEQGLFLIRAPAANQYRLRAEGEGYRASTFPPFSLEADQVLAYRLLVPAIRTLAQAPASAESSVAQELLTRACPDGVPEGLPVIVGQVLDATSQQPVPNAEVELMWSNVPDVLRGAMAEDMDASGGGVAVSGSTGFYGVCGAPARTSITMIARAGDRLSRYVGLRFEAGRVTIGDSSFATDGPIWRQDLTVRSPRNYSAVLTGAVVDTSGRQIEGARVQLMGTRLSAESNRLGAFRLMGAPPGPAQVHIERLGYHPIQETIDVPASGTVDVPLFRLTPLATQLAPIAVEARGDEVRRNLEEFNRRRETTNGSFLTRAEFAEMGNVQVTADVLRRMRGLRVEPGHTIDNRWIITSARGGGRTAADPSGRCYPIVFRDRLYLGTTASVDVDRAVPLVELEAVEVYTSSAGMPPEFNRPGATCGVIAFWTR